MSRNTIVTFKPGECSALSTQTSGIYPYGFPFTLNPTLGCFFGCKYCYSPISLRKLIYGKRDSFFEEVTVRLGVPEQLEKELKKICFAASAPEESTDERTFRLLSASVIF